MILPYAPRLACLCLAAFFLLHAILGLVAMALTGRAMRWASRLPAARGAWALLALRLFPAAFALFLVAGLCTPSYLKLEPASAREPVGIACLLAASMGAAAWALSLTRAARAVLRSRRHMRDCQTLGREMRVAGAPLAACVVDSAKPFVVLAGVMEPRLFVSRPVVEALSPEQLAAVIRHERAHAIARDNLKRLLIQLAPDPLPFFGGYRRLEKAWGRITEWAADDRAAAGKPSRSLSLASALVNVARLGAAPSVSAAASPLLSEGAELTQRVDRLLHPAPRPVRTGHEEPTLTVSSALLVAAAVLALIVQPAILHGTHEFLEILIQ